LDFRRWTLDLTPHPSQNRAIEFQIAVVTLKVRGRNE